jgi:hypothetical protein
VAQIAQVGRSTPAERAAKLRHNKRIRLEDVEICQTRVTRFVQSLPRASGGRQTEQ